MTDNERKGYEIAKGVTSYFAWPLCGLVVIMIIFNLLRAALGWGLDDSDKDGWNRSGLIIHTDAKTGIEYLSDGKGGLVRREYR
jgi:hypothetical protein